MTLPQVLSSFEFAPVILVKCSPILGQRELEFSWVKAQAGGGADEPFMSEIGTLLPIALCKRQAEAVQAV